MNARGARGLLLKTKGEADFLPVTPYISHHV